MPAFARPLVPTLIGLLLLPAVAVAQGAGSERLYLVEVIAFEQGGQVSTGGEIWHREPLIRFDPDRYSGAPSGTAPGEPSTGVSSQIPAAGELEPQPDPIQFTQLRHLEPHLVRLGADPRYQVVTHAAWLQPLFDRAEAVPVQIMGTSDPGYGSYPTFLQAVPPLSGTVRVYESRLLFVDVDVVYDIRDIYSYSGSGTSYSGSVTPLDRPPGEYLIQEKRRVKLNELHYFDHPFFGVLLRVSRWTPETDNTSSEG